MTASGSPTSLPVKLADGTETSQQPVSSAIPNRATRLEGHLDHSDTESMPHRKTARPKRRTLEPAWDLIGQRLYHLVY